MKVYGVIMAGGSGTRFWPLSRSNRPKQFLNLSGKDMMINETIDRLAYTIHPEDIFVVTNAAHADLVQSATAGRLKADHILAEPAARNTAVCIGYAAMEIARKYGDGIMVVAPSDAYIRDTAAFTRVLADAIGAARDQDRLVTIGITPSFPSTGYGYIQYDQNQNSAARNVAQFKEKPDEETARAYLSAGNYAWNSGMFIWKTSTVLESFKSYAPDIYDDLCKIGDAMNTPDEKETIQRIYPNIRKISVDYAIMEPAAADGNVLVVPGEFGWNDIGSWDMMHILHECDECGNILLGDALAVNSSNCTLYASGKLVATVGMEGIVVVETPDAVMVCPKERAQDVKYIVEALKSAGRRELT